MDLIRERLQQWALFRMGTVVMAVPLILFLSLVMSCTELRYITSGKTADAFYAGTHVEKFRGRYGRQSFQRIANVRFVDGTENRNALVKVPMDWESPVEPGGTIQVEYFPGREYSVRLKGDRKWGWLSIFFGSVAVTVVGGAIFLWKNR